MSSCTLGKYTAAEEQLNRREQKPRYFFFLQLSEMEIL